jgi:hypothetical protein
MVCILYSTHLALSLFDLILVTDLGFMRRYGVAIGFRVMAADERK